MWPGLAKLDQARRSVLGPLSSFSYSSLYYCRRISDHTRALFQGVDSSFSASLHTLIVLSNLVSILRVRRMDGEILWTEYSVPRNSTTCKRITRDLRILQITMNTTNNMYRALLYRCFLLHGAPVLGLNLGLVGSPFWPRALALFCFRSIYSHIGVLILRW